MEPSRVMRGTGCGITAASKAFSRPAAITRWTRLEQYRFRKSFASFFATPELTTPAESRKEDTIVRKLADSGKLKIRCMVTPAGAAVAAKITSRATDTNVRSASSVAQRAMPRTMAARSRFCTVARASGLSSTVRSGSTTQMPALIYFGFIVFSFILIRKLYHVLAGVSRLQPVSGILCTGEKTKM